MYAELQDVVQAIVLVARLSQPIVEMPLDPYGSPVWESGQANVAVERDQDRRLMASKQFGSGVARTSNPRRTT